MAIAKLLVNGSLQELISTASKLGVCRRSVDFLQFQKTLRGIGMCSMDEIIACWNAIDVEHGDPSYWSNNGTQDSKLSAACGILLDSKSLPHNYLLYRLVQCMFPNILSVTIEMVLHKGKVLPERWEYAGCGKRKVMVLRFPPVPWAIPKKSKTKRRSRRSYMDRW